MRDERAFTAILVCLMLGLWWMRPKPDTALSARIAQLEGQLHAARQQVTQAKSASDKLTQVVNTRRARVMASDSTLHETLRRADSVATDSTSTADTLRLTLVKTVEQAEVYRAEVLRYQEIVDTLLIAHQRERQYTERQMRVMQEVIDAQAEALTPCTRFGVRCPTRTQSFLMGFAIAVTVAVLL